MKSMGGGCKVDKTLTTRSLEKLEYVRRYCEDNHDYNDHYNYYYDCCGDTFFRRLICRSGEKEDDEHDEKFDNPDLWETRKAAEPEYPNTCGHEAESRKAAAARNRGR